MRKTKNKLAKTKFETQQAVKISFNKKIVFAKNKGDYLSIYKCNVYKFSQSDRYNLIKQSAKTAVYIDISPLKGGDHQKG